jgi:hypothetical protein
VLPGTVAELRDDEIVGELGGCRVTLQEGRDP